MSFIENIRDIFFYTTKELNNLNYKTKMEELSSSILSIQL